MSKRDAEFTAYVAAQQVHLRRVAYAVCGDWDRAEDLLQTALTKLYVAWPRLHRDGLEYAYARQIIVRANLDEMRRPWRRRETLGLGLAGMNATAPDSPALENRAALVEALQALPEMQRKVVVLRYWLGLSVDETAADLRISTGTVKSHSHRALARLRSTMSDHHTS